METDEFVTLQEAAREPYVSEGMLKTLTLESGRIPFFWNGEEALVRVEDVEDFFKELITLLNDGDFDYWGEDPRFTQETAYEVG